MIETEASPEATPSSEDWTQTPWRKLERAVYRLPTQTLRLHRTTSIRRHVKVKGTASPFDGNLVYWAKRLRDHPLTGGTLGRLLTAQQGRCTACGLLFRDDDLLEIDHTLPTSQGGGDQSTNLQVLHRHCHDQKSAADARTHATATG